MGLQVAVGPLPDPLYSTLLLLMPLTSGRLKLSLQNKLAAVMLLDSMWSSSSVSGAFCAGLGLFFGREEGGHRDSA